MNYFNFRCGKRIYEFVVVGVLNVDVFGVGLSRILDFLIVWDDFFMLVVPWSWCDGCEGFCLYFLISMSSGGTDRGLWVRGVLCLYVIFYVWNWGIGEMAWPGAGRSSLRGETVVNTWLGWGLMMMRWLLLRIDFNFRSEDYWILITWVSWSLFWLFKQCEEICLELFVQRFGVVHVIVYLNVEFWWWSVRYFVPFVFSMLVGGRGRGCNF